MSEIITKLQELAATHFTRTELLRNERLLKWLMGDYEDLFRSTRTHRRKVDRITEQKNLEDEWGRDIYDKFPRNTEKKKTTQWTGPVGEAAVRDLLKLLELKPSGAKRREHLEPDWICEKYIVEVKTGTYLTSGTAHEKILGVPYKYAAAPILYELPLLIVCVGRADIIAREYGLYLDDNEDDDDDDDNEDDKNKKNKIRPESARSQRRQVERWAADGIFFVSVRKLMVCAVNGAPQLLPGYDWVAPAAFPSAAPSSAPAQSSARASPSPAPTPSPSPAMLPQKTSPQKSLESSKISLKTLEALEALESLESSLETLELA